MQNTLNRIKDLQNKGISIKAIAYVSSISVDTLYSITNLRKKNVSSEEKQKIDKALDTLEKAVSNA